MKEKFSWYFSPDENEIKEIWDQAILTLDANVLLDLYRYHEDTRNALLNALKKFKGRAWLSHQTADEFFRNRKRVIVSSVKSFNEADQDLSKIRAGAEESLNRLSSNRIIPDAVADNVRAALNGAVQAAQESVQNARSHHPDFLRDDPILNAITDLFDGAVGDGFNAQELENETKEGKRRTDTKIPPGYLDAKKDGTRPYGDYFMWRQILNHATKAKKPVIFVTSEGKEDWWENVSGRTTGLQYDLIKEAYQATGKRLLAYQTDRFFRFSAELSGEESNESAAKEISDLVKARAAPLVRVVSQIETLASQERNSGKLTVELLRPTYNFTCSGHFEPNVSEIPSIKVRLTTHPDDIPTHIVRSGAGTTFDFNVHVKSTAYEKHLPPGEYVFEYEASIPDQTPAE